MTKIEKDLQTIEFYKRQLHPTDKETQFYDAVWIAYRNILELSSAYKKNKTITK